MTIFTAAIEQASDILWNSLLLFLLVGTGVFFTIRLRGVQLRRFGEDVYKRQSWSCPTTAFPRPAAWAS